MATPALAGAVIITTTRPLAEIRRPILQNSVLTNDSNKDDLFDEEDATITVDPGREYYAGLIYRF